MSSKTKIIVLHMREIIYTVVFAVLALILILLLFFMFGPKKEEKKPEVENQFVYTNLEEQMKSLIGTKVSVHAKANGKGKIEIEYYSPDDLERIYELLMTIQHN